MTQDEQHLDLLAIFHYIVGGLTALFSCIFLIHVAIGIAMLCEAFDGKAAAPKFLAWFFILFPSVFILAGWILADRLQVRLGLQLHKLIWDPKTSGV